MKKITPVDSSWYLFNHITLSPLGSLYFSCSWTFHLVRKSLEFMIPHSPSFWFFSEISKESCYLFPAMARSGWRILITSCYPWVGFLWPHLITLFVVHSQNFRHAHEQMCVSLKSIFSKGTSIISQAKYSLAVMGRVISEIVVPEF